MTVSVELFRVTVSVSGRSPVAEELHAYQGVSIESRLGNLPADLSLGVRRVVHVDVRLAAVIGVPDPVRTESIKAFLVLAEGLRADPGAEAEIREMVKARLARHEYPRAIEFVDSLPTTTTGKIMRRELREPERRSSGNTNAGQAAP